jgi:hypothetical protein
MRKKECIQCCWKVHWTTCFGDAFSCLKTKTFIRFSFVFKVKLFVLRQLKALPKQIVPAHLSAVLNTLCFFLVWFDSLEFNSQQSFQTWLTMNVKYIHYRAFDSCSFEVSFTPNQYIKCFHSFSAYWMVYPCLPSWPRSRFCFPHCVWGSHALAFAHGVIVVPNYPLSGEWLRCLLLKHLANCLVSVRVLGG